MPALTPRLDPRRRWRSGLHGVRAAVVGFVAGMTYNVAASLAIGGLPVEVFTSEDNEHVGRSRHVAAAHVVPHELTRDPGPALTEWLLPQLAERSIDVVVPADYHSFVWLAEARDAIAPVAAFPVPSRAIIEFYNDKFRVAEACRRVGIDTPLTTLVEHRDELDDLPHTGPVIVKPPAAGGSYGVYRLRSVRDLRRHLDATDRPGNALPLIVQEYVPGIDLDVTVVTQVGRVVESVVSEHVPGTRGLRYVEHPRAVVLADAVAELGGYHGVLDFDMREDPTTGRLLVVDTNPRLTGSTLVKTWAGANLPLTGVRLALGLPVHVEPAVGEHHPLDGRLPLELLRHGWSPLLSPTRNGLRHAVGDLPFYVARVRH